MELKFCRKLFGFDLYAYKINPDHVHLLICPNKTYNYSKIMQFIKRHFTRDCNFILSVSDEIGGGKPSLIKGDIRECRLYQEPILSEPFGASLAQVKRHRNNVLLLKKVFWTDKKSAIDIPRFKWQKSFHYHYVTGEKDLINHVQYIQNQADKHGLSENKYCYIDKDMAKLNRESHANHRY
jgi:REP element-mobilizing transposase RayT